MHLLALRLAPLGVLLLAATATGIWAKPGEKARPGNRESATTRSAAPPRVDSARVHDLYLEGEFDTAIAILEANLRETRPYRREDSIFIFKHLGVMYAAQFDTREKGKYFMHRLLSVEPTARILDMYASDMIYMIFRTIQEEYEQARLYSGSRRQGRAGNDTLAAPAVAKPKPDRKGADAGPRQARASTSGKKWMWGGAAVASVAVGVGAYYLMSEEPLAGDGRDFEY